MKEKAKVLSDINNVTRDMIRLYIKQHGINMNTLSKLSGINQPTLSKFMNGQNLSSVAIEKLGKFFSK